MAYYKSCVLTFKVSLRLLKQEVGNFTIWDLSTNVWTK